MTMQVQPYLFFDARHEQAPPRSRSMLARALWTVQGLLALIFLFAGGMKLVLPLQVLTGQMALPGPFVRFIGVNEVLGAIGLILPGILHTRRELTPLAGAGLATIMVGATVFTLTTAGAGPALIPLGVGLLAAFVAYYRWQLLDESRKIER
jgi:hypothetical protein